MPYTVWTTKVARTDARIPLQSVESDTGTPKANVKLLKNGNGKLKIKDKNYG